MIEKRLFIITIIVAVLAGRSLCQSDQNFTINKTWNGFSLPDGVEISLSLIGSPGTNDITLQIKAPFFNDPAPAGPANTSFYQLWDYEVVEVFFLNDANQYLEVEVGPGGQYIVLLLNGVRNVVRHSLPLSVSTTIEASTWTGTVVIPGDYFPTKVTKFNAYAKHGTGALRQNWALYPADDTLTTTDFHALQFFKPINISAISPDLGVGTLSTLWENALNGQIRYSIDRTWNGQPTGVNIPVTIILTSGPNPTDIVVNITAPFFADPGPNGKPGQPFLGLWDYEVVEVFFLNDKNQYLEVEIGPFGQHIVLMLAGERNTIRHSLPLNVSTSSGRHLWQGTAVIPGSYLPSNVTKFNAYAIHGTGINRTYWALYPAASSAQAPNFHNLKFFKPIDLDVICPSNIQDEPSLLWQDALQGIILYDLDTQWSGSASTVGDVVLTLQGFQGGVEVNFTVSNNVKFMPLRYATLIFQNIKGEALKLILTQNEKHTVSLLNGTEVVLEESSPMDYRVVEVDEFLKASVLIVPDYFPPNVKLINSYFTFGIAVQQVISLQPINIPDDQIDVTPNLESSDHFAQIDFEFVIENNTHYSPKWLALGFTSDQAVVAPEVVVGVEVAVASMVETSNTSESNTTLSTNSTIEATDPVASVNVTEATPSESVNVTEATTTTLESVNVTEATPSESVNVTEATTTTLESVNVTEATPSVSVNVTEATPSESVNATEATPSESVNATEATPASLLKTSGSLDSEVESKRLPIMREEVPVNLGSDVKQRTDEKPTKPEQVSNENEGTQTGRVKAERRIDDGFPDRNVLQIPFKLFFEPQSSVVKDAQDQVTTDVLDIEKEAIPLEDNEDTVLINGFEEAVPGKDLEETMPKKDLEVTVLESDLEGPVPETDLGLTILETHLDETMPEEGFEGSVPETDLEVTIPEKSIEGNESEKDLEDTIDRLLDILNSGPAPKDSSGNLLPPPHPICFAPGLVADNFRCQVFYECVLEEGRWEVYNWRCKRGYFYDAEKVACIRGYC